MTLGSGSSDNIAIFILLRETQASRPLSTSKFAAQHTDFEGPVTFQMQETENALLR